MDSQVAAEWDKVKGCSQSLFKHYGSQAEYQKWRHRFLKAGYLEKTSRTFIKKDHDQHTEEHRREQARAYARKWRQQNKQRAKEICYNHWKRKLLGDFAAVRLNPA
jgi:hypothetical protein